MGRVEPGEGYNGAKRERGFLPIENTGEGLFKDLPSEITVWHNHCDEVKELPDGFRATASNETCPIQAMQQKGRRLYGVQFHPELFNEQHPEGQQIVENFLKL
jgi:GMP synthase (glutamine-hydrolysing)